MIKWLNDLFFINSAFGATNCYLVTQPFYCIWPVDTCWKNLWN